MVCKDSQTTAYMKHVIPLNFDCMRLQMNSNSSVTNQTKKKKETNKKYSNMLKLSFKILLEEMSFFMPYG